MDEPQGSSVSENNEDRAKPAESKDQRSAYSIISDANNDDDDDWDDDLDDDQDEDDDKNDRSEKDE